MKNKVKTYREITSNTTILTQEIITTRKHVAKNLQNFIK